MGSPTTPGAPVTLTLGQSVTTTTPQVTIAGFTRPGAYTFSLVVTDVHGLSSGAATAVVQVTARIG